jgi:hypothetical protein
MKLVQHSNVSLQDFPRIVAWIRYNLQILAHCSGDPSLAKRTRDPTVVNSYAVLTEGSKQPSRKGASEIGGGVESLQPCNDFSELIVIEMLDFVLLWPTWPSLPPKGCHVPCRSG